MPRVDPFSFTRNGQPWVADQWLAEGGMAAVHRVAGWDGLLLIAVTILAATYAWLAARLLRGGLHWLPTALLLALVLLAGSPQFHVRPLVLTIGLLGVTFAWLVDVDAGRRSCRQLWWFVPLLVFWANVHGGVLAGLGTVGLCAFGWCAAWALGKPSPVHHFRDAIAMLVLTATLPLTLLVNPYGLALPQALWETLAMPLPSLIDEHAPLDFADPFGGATLLLAAMYLIVLLATLPRWPRVAWLLPLVWFLLAIQRVRNAPLFAVTTAVALADLLPQSRAAKWLQHRGMFAPLSPSAPSDWRAAMLPLVVVLAAMTIQAAGVSLPVVGRGWARFDPARWPVDLLPKLAEINDSNPADTRIFNDLDFGGFLMYHAPRLRVFVDDRCSLYGGEFLRAYDHARRDDPAQIDRWQRQYGFRYALVQSGGQFDRHLAAAGQWTLLGRTPVAALYQRTSGSIDTRMLE